MTWAPVYAALEDLRGYIGIDDGADDAELQFALEAASRAIDRETNRQFGQVASAEERWYPVQRCGTGWAVSIDDLMDTSGLSPTGTLLPRNAAQKSRPYTALRLTDKPDTDDDGLTAVTGVWGWSQIPYPIVQATLLQANRFFIRRHSPYGIAGSPDTGSEMRLLSRVDPDVAVALGPYLRWWAAA